MPSDCSAFFHKYYKYNKLIFKEYNMKYQTAKELLLSEGYRIVSEDFEDDVAYEDVVDTNTEAMPDEGGEQLDSDVFGAVEQGLGHEGFDAQEVADIMTANNERIDELSQKGVTAEDIVKILAYENCECEDETTEDMPADDGVEFDDEQFDEAYMTEGKSKPKGDKFSHKEKVAGRKPKGCCGGKKGGKCTDDDDDDLDEALEDVPGLTRGPRGQVGTDNWDDFKDDFRAKTLFLKKSLTPQFVSGIIKDTDFEVDDKEIKAYAFKVIDEVFGTKNPVKNLQARIRSHFVK